MYGSYIVLNAFWAWRRRTLYYRRFVYHSLLLITRGFVQLWKLNGGDWKNTLSSMVNWIRLGNQWSAWCIKQVWTGKLLEKCEDDAVPSIYGRVCGDTHTYNKSAFCSSFFSVNTFLHIVSQVQVSPFYSKTWQYYHNLTSHLSRPNRLMSCCVASTCVYCIVRCLVSLLRCCQQVWW